MLRQFVAVLLLAFAAVQLSTATPCDSLAEFEKLKKATVSTIVELEAYKQQLLDTLRKDVQLTEKQHLFNLMTAQVVEQQQVVEKLLRQAQSFNTHVDRKASFCYFANDVLLEFAKVRIASEAEECYKSSTKDVMNDNVVKINGPIYTGYRLLKGLSKAAITCSQVSKSEESMNKCLEREVTRGKQNLKKLEQEANECKGNGANAVILSLEVAVESRNCNMVVTKDLKNTLEATKDSLRKCLAVVQLV